ncbi:MAG: PIN domain-containing protein [Bifidobacteriaceae bacterium]|jgi:predicted nucleic acid-binding protein|nr:PIN domain-containing protein [Bifidobacteriaceae bacterium]
MSGEAFFDSNVLVYAYDGADARKQRIARGLIDVYSPVFSAQVLSEFYWVVTRKLAVPAAKAEAAVAKLRAFPVQPITAALVAAAIHTARRHRLAYWDALIVEAAVGAGCSVLLSEDLATGSAIRGVMVANPFA